MAPSCLLVLSTGRGREPQTEGTDRKEPFMDNVDTAAADKATEIRTALKEAAAQVVTLREHVGHMIEVATKQKDWTATRSWAHAGVVTDRIADQLDIVMGEGS